MKATGPGLTCPKCGSDKLDVKDSRASGDRIRRRRHCGGCGERFTTYETIISEQEEHDRITLAKMFADFQRLPLTVRGSVMALIARIAETTKEETT